MWRVTLLCALVCCQIQGLKLPDYIKPCARNNPDFNACAKKSALAAIPNIIVGDPKYKVPVLEPLLIEELIIEEGTQSVGMTMTARNATMTGLKDVEIKETRFDFDKQVIEYDIYMPKLVINCIYNVTGKILLLPIQGHGPGKITLKQVSATYSYNYEFVTKKSKRYLVPKNSKLSFNPKGLSIHLENLFNGDKFLGNNLNRFINENWEEILKDVGPVIAEALSKFMQEILTNIFLTVPYDDAIPPIL